MISQPHGVTARRQGNKLLSTAEFLDCTNKVTVDVYISLIRRHDNMESCLSRRISMGIVIYLPNGGASKVVAPMVVDDDWAVDIMHVQMVPVWIMRWGIIGTDMESDKPPVMPVLTIVPTMVPTMVTVMMWFPV